MTFFFVMNLGFAWGVNTTTGAIQKLNPLQKLKPLALGRV